MQTRRRFRKKLWFNAAVAMVVAACGEPTQVPVPVAPHSPIAPPTTANGTTILVGEIDMAVNAEYEGPSGAIFRQSGFETSAGTGVVNPFLKTNTNLTAYNAFNTSGTQPPTVDNSKTKDLPLNLVPSVVINNIAYREFRLDINQNLGSPDNLLSLDAFKIYISGAQNIPTDANNLPAFPAGTNEKLAYDLGVNGPTWLKMNGELSSGSGGGDIFFYIPESVFNNPGGTNPGYNAGISCPYDGGVGPNCGKYLTLVVRFGDHYANNDGFEEFAVRKLPYATKTAAWTYDEQITWAITKNIDKASNGTFSGTSVSFDLWDGQSATAYYKVAVTKTVSKVNNKISGQITVSNPDSKTDYPNGVTATDVFQGINATVTCPAGPLAGGGTVVCDYVVNLGSTEPTLPATNTAVATVVVSASLTLTMPASKVVPANSGTASGTVTGPNSVTVTDAFDGGNPTNLGQNVSASTTFNVYSHPFTCSTAEGSHPNTAKIVETNQTASATATVNCYNLTVSKTATPAFTRTYSWAITKQVKKQGAADNTYDASKTYDMFKGDQGIVTYKVTATRSFSDGSYGVTGDITISNPSAHSVVVRNVADAIDQSVGAAAISSCDGGTTPNGTDANQRTLTAGGSLVCHYSKSGITAPGTKTFTNTATATGRIAAVGASSDKGFDGTQTFTFVGVTPSTSGYPTVTVTDAFNGGQATNLATNYDGSSPIATFDRTLVCSSTGSTTYPNTATIVETGQQASASATANCFGLTVTKTANATLDRTWSWTLNKLREPANAPATITLPAGGTYNYGYKLTLDASSQDNNWAAAGVITISNPAPIAAVIAEVADTVDQSGTKTKATVTGAPTSVAAKSGGTNGTATANYSVSLPNGTDGTNTATARTQNRQFTGTGTTNLSGTTPYTGSNVVDFPGTVTQINSCVKVFDNKTGGTPIDLGTVCAPNGVPWSLTYFVDLAAPTACDATVTYTNTANAYFYANGNVGTLASGPKQVSVVVNTAPCPTGCTLTQGYWKTHNGSFGADKKNGRKGPPIHVFTGASTAWNGYDLWKFFTGTPAPVPTGITLLTPPFQTGNPTWFANFTTPPAGNPYYQASHQFMAAMLNIAAGASGSAVDTELGKAYTFFLTASPTKAWTDAERTQLLQWGALFGSFNEGAIGPGHCSEDARSLAASLGG